MPLNASEAAYIAANRFGLGIKPGELDRIAANPQGWLKAQIGNTGDLVRIIPHQLKSSSDMLWVVQQAREMRDKDPEKQKEINKQARETWMEESYIRFQNAVQTATPFAERLTHFWGNHFTVSGKSKAILSGIIGSFEREAIRPHVFGYFEDMVIAAEQHPAMLQYLDNAQSIGPNSQAGKRRKRGLNENLAREIMELHTLGVNGGYTQADVIALAKIITGWSLKPPKIEGRPGFMFVPQMHEPGVKTLLGRNYGTQGDAAQTAQAINEGVAALRDLARHPATARFVATKLARHFIADTPPQSAIDKLESAFKSSRGHLPTVYKTLVDMPEAWHSDAGKFKPPHDYLISVYRLSGATIGGADAKRRIQQALVLFDHQPFMALSPAGWGDTEGEWLSPDSLINRVEWAYSFARQIQNSIPDPTALAQGTIGPVTPATGLTAIAQAPSKADAIALVLASPAMMRR